MGFGTSEARGKDLAATVSCAAPSTAQQQAHEAARLKRLSRWQAACNCSVLSLADMNTMQQLFRRTVMGCIEAARMYVRVLDLCTCCSALLQVAGRTNDSAGDGTTTASVLARDMIHFGLQVRNKQGGCQWNRRVAAESWQALCLLHMRSSSCTEGHCALTRS
jgi:hypothetical protein